MNLELIQSLMGKPLRIIWKAERGPRRELKEGLMYPWYIKGIRDNKYMVIECPACDIQYEYEPVNYFETYYIFVPWETILSNKGQDKCIKCQCPTEMRRDFSDFSIREMCPRCRI